MTSKIDEIPVPPNFAWNIAMSNAWKAGYVEAGIVGKVRGFCETRGFYGPGQEHLCAAYDDGHRVGNEHLYLKAAAQPTSAS